MNEPLDVAAASVEDRYFVSGIAVVGNTVSPGADPTTAQTSIG